MEQQRPMTREEWISSFVQLMANRPNAQAVVVIDDPADGIIVMQSWSSLSWTRGLIRTAYDMILLRIRQTVASNTRPLPDKIQQEVVQALKLDTRKAN